MCYTICASKMDLCIGLVKYRTRYGRPRTGICSAYTAALTLNQKVYLSIVKGSYSILYGAQGLARSNSHISPQIGVNSVFSGIGIPTTTPLIMVGPGTGVAPMRAIIQERSSITSNSTGIHTVLFYGCRKYMDDCLYHDEWLAYLNDIPSLRLSTAREGGGVNSTAGTTASTVSTTKTNENIFVSVAFSQEKHDQLDASNSPPELFDLGPTPLTVVGKVYVTHKIKHHHEMLWRMIEQGAVIFIAGSAKRMPQDVRSAFIHVIQKHYIPSKPNTISTDNVTSNNSTPKDQDEGEMKCTLDEATLYFNTVMVKRNRYIVEAWS